MSSPFPGMDPFIEAQVWEDFHATALPVMREQLAQRLPRGYVAYVQGRVYYAEDRPGMRQPRFLPDSTLAERPASAAPAPTQITTSAAVAQPRKSCWTELVERREAYLEVREAGSQRVVTVLELLSPTNKRRRHPGRRLFLTKRRRLLERETHYVEINLLRGGDSICTIDPPPKDDYYVIVSRSETRPEVDLYSWRLAEPLPTIPIPLLRGDSDVPLELAAVLKTVYERSLYENLLDYTQPLLPPLASAEEAFVRTLLERYLAARKTD